MWPKFHESSSLALPSGSSGFFVLELPNYFFNAQALPVRKSQIILILIYQGGAGEKRNAAKEKNNYYRLHKLYIIIRAWLKARLVLYINL